MCRTQSFKYTVCGHSYAKIISACGGSTTHASRAGIRKVSCNPAEGLKKKKGGLTIHYPLRCAYCTKEALKANGQREVERFKLHGKKTRLRVVRQRAERAEREHQEMCTTLDAMFVDVPVAKRCITLPPPPMRKSVVGGSRLKNDITLERAGVGQACEEDEENKEISSAASALARPKLTLHLRRPAKMVHDGNTTKDCGRCGQSAGALQAGRDGR